MDGIRRGIPVKSHLYKIIQEQPETTSQSYQIKVSRP